MKCMTNRLILAAAAVFLTTGLVYAVSSVSSVTMAQQANSRDVEITYTLTGEAAIVTLAIETNNAVLPDSAVTRLTGDVATVIQPGANKSIVWKAGLDWPEHTVTNARARVTAWSTNAPPQVLVLDLSGGASASSYPVTYYVSTEALPYGGVTNNFYKSDYLVMRKIPSGSFKMGKESAPVDVILSQDFYVGVFEVTQGQWYNVMGYALGNFTDQSSRTFRPVEMVSYYHIREKSDPELPPISPNWPQTDAVEETSFMGQLRTKTGFSGFDLPTTAQWEYACRGKTDTCFNDGNMDANVTGGNANTNEWLNALGRYKFNGGYFDGSSPAKTCGPENGTAIVGSYQPNGWELYDMHGNVWEWCLDWATSPLQGGENPPGAPSGTQRCWLGGGWSAVASQCCSASRSGYAPTLRSPAIGFRLVRNLP